MEGYIYFQKVSITIDREGFLAPGSSGNKMGDGRIIKGGWEGGRPWSLVSHRISLVSPGSRLPYNNYYWSSSILEEAA